MTELLRTGAWVRTEDNTYGFDKFPFGRCSDCEEPACHRIPADYGERFVCQTHLPQDILFCPFLGQQEKLFAATERWVLGGGGAGGSKTYAGARLWMKQYEQEQQRYERGEIEQSMGWFIFFRRTMPELIQVIEEFKLYKDKIGKNRWDDAHKLCIFENGYKVQFGGIQNDDDYLKYYGAAYTMMVFDEATQFTKKQIRELDSRLRCADPVLDKQVQLYLLTNPVGGETKAYLKRRFVKHGPEVRVRVEAKLADGRVVQEYQVYIPCNLYDNPALLRSGRYEASLMGKGEAMRRALLLNDWDVDEGSWIGSDWDPTVHICAPFAIPRSWQRYKACDYGYGRSDSTNTRTSVLWFAVDPEDNHICYRAYSCRGLTAFELGHRIKQIEKQPLRWKDPRTGRTITITQDEWDEERDCSTVFGPMDASMWSAQGESATGESRGEIMDNIGCGFFRSDKGKVVREQSGEHIRNRLRSRTPDASGSIDPGIPGLRFFAQLTESRIRSSDGDYLLTGPTHTIPECPFDPKNPDIWDTDADDHDLDTLGYFELSRPQRGEKPEDDENVTVLFTVPAPVKRTSIAW